MLSSLHRVQGSILSKFSYKGAAIAFIFLGLYYRLSGSNLLGWPICSNIDKKLAWA
jgi:hypothetical protein